MPDPVEFHTPRLRARQWREEDKEAFAALNADPRAMEFFPATLGRAESDAMVDHMQKLIASRGWGFWALETADESRFIGFAGLHIPAHAVPASPCVEIGWRLATAFWGKGYATEAATGALQVGFDRLGLAEVVSFTAENNQRSRAVMARLGMRYGGERFAHPALAADHPLSMHVLYRLSREQWDARNS